MRKIPFAGTELTPQRVRGLRGTSELPGRPARTVYVYVCMYGHTYSKSMDQPGKVANPARGQLNKENEYFNISLSPFAPENLVSRDGFGSPVPRQHAHLDTQPDSSRVPRRRPFIYLKPLYAIGSVPSISSHAIANRWRSLPRVCRHRASKPQGSSKRVLPWQVTMDKLTCAFSFPHPLWYQVDRLKVPAKYVYYECIYGQHFKESMDQPGMVASPARDQLNREKYVFPCPRSRLRIWTRETSLAVPSPASAWSFSKFRLNLVLTHGIPTAFRDGVHMYRQPSSGQSQVHRVTRMRTDVVHCGESTDTGSVALEAGPVHTHFWDVV